MKKRLAALAVAASVLGFAAFSATPTQAATHTLYPYQSCLPDGSVRVTFQWQGNNPGAYQQWLDLSLFNNNWEWGTFLGAGPMHGSQNQLTWDGLIPNATHFVRVNQLLPNGWDPSPTFYFTTINCTPKPTPPPVSDTWKQVYAPIEEADVVKISNTRYHLAVTAGLPGGCAKPDGYDVQKSGNVIYVKVFNQMPADDRPCTMIYGYYDVTINLGDLVEGQEYLIRVNDEFIRYKP